MLRLRNVAPPDCLQWLAIQWGDNTFKCSQSPCHNINSLSGIHIILTLLYYRFIVTFYLRLRSTPFLSPLSCLNSSILGLTFLDLPSDNKYSDVNVSCLYLSATVLKSLSLLLIVRHLVHILLVLWLLGSMFGLDCTFILPINHFQILSKSF